MRQDLRKEFQISNLFANRAPSDYRYIEGLPSTCFIELFGVIPKTSIEKGHGLLVDSEVDLTENEWICLFVHSWVRRESLVAYDTMRPLFVICAPNSTNVTHSGNICNDTYVGRRVNFTLKLNVSLNREPNNFKTMKSSFTLKSPMSIQFANNTTSYEVGVVAIAPYLDWNLDASILISNWIFHHTNLGFKVIFYDRNGTYRDEVEDSIYRYSSRYCEDKSDICRRTQEQLTRQLTYHPYTLREMIGYEDRSQRHARTDQDKALTYSHGRFEYQQRWFEAQKEESDMYGGIKSLLVIDFDEFVYCPSTSTSIANQYAEILKTVKRTKHSLVADEIVFGRFAVNNVSNLSECLSRRYEERVSIFPCYGTWKTGARHSTFKSMHHSFACPSTDFHFACTGVCTCRRKGQGNCALFHFRPLYSGHTGFKKENAKREVLYVTKSSSQSDKKITSIENDAINQDELVGSHELESIWLSSFWI